MRAIVVGLGGRARSWLQAAEKSAEVDLAGFVEPSAEQRQKAIEANALDDQLIFDDLAAAAQAVEADFIIDVTPPKAHEAVAMVALEHGLHILGEKPMSDDFAAAKRMAAASAAAGKVHMVTQNYRYSAVPRTAHRLLKEGAIGEPGFCLVNFFMPWATRAGTHYVTMPYPLITDMGIHHFDLLRYVLDREPLRVHTVCWNQSWGWHAGDACHVFHAEFEGGLRVTHNAVGCCVGKKSPNYNGEWQIEGGEGSLTLEGNQVFLTRCWPNEQAKRDEVPLDTVPGGQDGLLAEFVAAITEGREPECSAQDNIKSLAMVFAGIKSDQEGRGSRLRRCWTEGPTEP